MPFGQFRNREIRRETCLRGFAGRDSIKSCFFAAETLKEHETSYEAGKYYIPIGSFLTYFVAEYEGLPAEPTKVKIFEKLGTNTNAVQTLTLTGTPTGGTWTASYGGQITSNIKYDASMAEIASALAALSTIATSENIAVTSTESKPINEEAAKVEFKGELAHEIQPLLIINNAGLTGGTTPKVTATTTTAGSTAEKIMGVYDGPEFDFWGNTSGEEGLNLDEPIPAYFHSCSFNIAYLPEYRKYGLLAEEALKNCTFY